MRTKERGREDHNHAQGEVVEERPASKNRGRNRRRAFPWELNKGAHYTVENEKAGKEDKDSSTEQRALGSCLAGFRGDDDRGLRYPLHQRVVRESQSLGNTREWNLETANNAMSDNERRHTHRAQMQQNIQATRAIRGADEGLREGDAQKFVSNLKGTERNGKSNSCTWREETGREITSVVPE